MALPASANTSPLAVMIPVSRKLVLARADTSGGASIWMATTAGAISTALTIGDLGGVCVDSETRQTEDSDAFPDEAFMGHQTAFIFSGACSSSGQNTPTLRQWLGIQVEHSEHLEFSVRVTANRFDKSRHSPMQDS